MKLLYFSIQDNFDLRIKRTRYLIILADTYVFLAKAQRRYVFKLNAGANAKEQRRNELGDTIVNAKKELTSIPLNSFGTVVEYLICSSFPGSRIKSGMTKMVSPSFPLPDLAQGKLRGNDKRDGMGICWEWFVTGMKTFTSTTTINFYKYSAGISNFVLKEPACSQNLSFDQL